MLLFFYITLALVIGYGILISYYERGWDALPYFDVEGSNSWVPDKKITVIIPARNEETAIVPCLQSLLQQNYPAHLFQVIVVNDHSTDGTVAAVQSLAAANVQLIHLADYLKGAALNSYKKKAIEVGVAAATGDIIVTTDADCTASAEWLKTYAAFFHLTNTVFLAAPVKIAPQKGLLAIFQALDFLILQGITAASVHRQFHSMCNGANLAYTRQAFYDVKGFENIDSIASGDDMLLMHKIATKFPGRYYFVKRKTAIVTTQPAMSWKAFLQQRIRWASKADQYTDKRIFWVLLLVYTVNFCLLVWLLIGLLQWVYLLYFLLLLVTKTILELSFVKKVADFFDYRSLMKYFFPMQPLHVLYTVAAGFLGKFSRYEWKGRKVK